MALPSFTEELLRLMWKHDCQQELFWIVDKDGSLVPSVICSDVFCWGSADVERITEENFPLLVKSLEDADKDGTDIYGVSLFAARSRKMRPQGAIYITENRNLWEMFNECGPERVIGPGNPYAPGTRS